jgi:hypothetical protein
VVVAAVAATPTIKTRRSLKTSKRCPVKQLLVLAVIVVIASAQSESPGTHCVLMAGVGCGNLVVHKTKRSDFLGDAEAEKRFASEGLNFSFGPDEVLDTIVATGKVFKTNLGIHPGDEEKQVQRVYGAGTVEKGTLSKGDVPIGTIGDRILCYSGIRFVIVKDRVWAIEIVPASKG